MTTDQKYLSKNFTESELNCRCGCGRTPNPIAVAALQVARDKLNKAINVTSGARCRLRNQEEGGAPNSYHIRGLAFDIFIPDPRYRLLLSKALFDAGFTTQIHYVDRMHVDMRPQSEAFMQIKID